MVSEAMMALTQVMLDCPQCDVRAPDVRTLAKHLLDRHGLGIDCIREGLRLTGVVSLPTFNRGMADQQYLFVNSRPVKERLLVGALRAAYRDLLARDRHPIAALFVEVPAPEVDINVHPAKTEVLYLEHWWPCWS